MVIMIHEDGTNQVQPSKGGTCVSHSNHMPMISPRGFNDDVCASWLERVEAVIPRDAIVKPHIICPPPRRSLRCARAVRGGGNTDTSGGAEGVSTLSSTKSPKRANGGAAASGGRRLVLHRTEQSTRGINMTNATDNKATGEVLAAVHATPFFDTVPFGDTPSADATAAASVQPAWYIFGPWQTAPTQHNAFAASFALSYASVSGITTMPRRPSGSCSTSPFRHNPSAKPGTTKGECLKHPECPPAVADIKGNPTVAANIEQLARNFARDAIRVAAGKVQATAAAAVITVAANVEQLARIFSCGVIRMAAEKVEAAAAAAAMTMERADEPDVSSAPLHDGHSFEFQFHECFGWDVEVEQDGRCDEMTGIQIDKYDRRSSTVASRCATPAATAAAAAARGIAVRERAARAPTLAANEAEMRAEMVELLGYAFVRFTTASTSITTPPALVASPQSHIESDHLVAGDALPLSAAPESLSSPSARDHFAARMAHKRAMHAAHSDVRALSKMMMLGAHAHAHDGRPLALK